MNEDLTLLFPSSHASHYSLQISTSTVVLAHGERYIKLGADVLGQARRFSTLIPAQQHTFRKTNWKSIMSFKLLIFASLMAVAMANRSPSKLGYPVPKYEDVPLCAKNSTKPWCLDDEVYPIYDIQKALNNYYQEVLALYKDLKAITPNSVDGLKDLSEETYLCPSSTAYVQPMRAVNVDGKWRVIVNKVESYNYLFTQTARIEECDIAIGSSCPLVPTCYDSKCVQKNIFHRFLVFDPYDYYFPFAIENFQLPASCGCVVGAYFP